MSIPALREAVIRLLRSYSGRAPSKNQQRRAKPVACPSSSEVWSHAYDAVNEKYRDLFTREHVDNILLELSRPDEPDFAKSYVERARRVEEEKSSWSGLGGIVSRTGIFRGGRK